MTAPARACAGCGVPLELDTTASWWLDRDIWVDPEQLDGATDHPDRGTTCTVLDVHTPEGAPDGS